MPELHRSSDSKARIWNNLGERVRRDFEFQAAAGSMPGVAVHRMTGYDDVVNSTLGAIWSGAGAYEYFTNAQPITVVSDSANDTYKGSGGWVLRIIGLDNKYEVQMEDLLLRGTTPVISQGVYNRVYEAVVLKADSRSGLDGIVTIQGKNDSIVVGYLNGVFNKMANAVFTVPAHTNAYLYALSFEVNVTQQILVGLRRSTPTVENSVWVAEVISLLDDGKRPFKTNIPLYFPALTDLELTAQLTGGNAGAIVAYATLILIDEAFEWDNLATRDEACSIQRRDDYA